MKNSKWLVIPITALLLFGCGTSSTTNTKETDANYLPKQSSTYTYSLQSGERVDVLEVKDIHTVTVFDGLNKRMGSDYVIEKDGLYQYTANPYDKTKIDKELLLKLPAKQGDSWNEDILGQATKFKVVSTDAKVKTMAKEFTHATIVSEQVGDRNFKFDIYDKDTGLIKTIVGTDPSWDSTSNTTLLELKEIKLNENYAKFAAYSGDWRADGKGTSFYYLNVFFTDEKTANIELRGSNPFPQLNYQVTLDEQGNGEFSFEEDTGGKGVLHLQNGSISLDISHQDKSKTAIQDLYEGSKTFQKTK